MEAPYLSFVDEVLGRKGLLRPANDDASGVYTLTGGGREKPYAIRNRCGGIVAEFVSLTDAARELTKMNGGT